ncbi:hypothetical protein GFS31_41590 (plasmid) [Leptolyngbya sp. BL0902]|nr:hypothetical protein GFS31_41590 [Leptolyngbya sp. BL0902]
MAEGWRHRIKKHRNRAKRQRHPVDSWRQALGINLGQGWRPAGQEPLLSVDIPSSKQN